MKFNLTSVSRHGGPPEEINVDTVEELRELSRARGGYRLIVGFDWDENGPAAGVVPMIEIYDGYRE